MGLKRILLALYLIMALLLGSLSVSAALGAPSLDVVMLNQEPDPVKPGDIVELRFQLENSGGGAVENVLVEIDVDYPFSLRPRDPLQQSLGTIEGYTRGDEVHNFEYKLIIDDGAVEGDHEITIHYQTSLGAWVEKKFDVSVQTVDANVAITKITSNPPELVPGETGTLSIEVKNFGDTSVKDLTLNLDFSDASLPLAPIGTSSEQKVSVLRANEKVRFDYSIIPYADASSRIYKVPVMLTFYGQTGTLFEKDDIIAIIVGATPELKVTLDRADVQKAGKAGEVTVRISNRGVSDVKFLTASIGKSNAIKVIGTSSKYIGGVDSDDFELATFNIYVEKGSEDVSIPLLLEYRDANNRAYKAKINLELPLYSSAEMRKYGLKEQSMWPALIIVVLIGVGIWYYRKKRKKR